MLISFIIGGLIGFILCCLFFFLFIGVETNTFVGTIILKAVSITLFYISAILIDKYGLI